MLVVMKRMSKVFIEAMLFLLFSSGTIVSQTTGKKRAESLNQFIQENYRTNWQVIPDSAKELIAISKEIRNRQFEADGNKFLGVYYFRMSEIDSSIYHYKLAAEINKELGNTLEQAKNTLNIGMSYRGIGEFEKTIEYSLEAARYFNEVDDYKGMAIVYNMVGSVYYYQERFEESLEYMERYLEHARKAEDIYETASANQNLGAVLSAVGRNSEAILYLIEASRLHKETGNSLGVANNLINIGSILLNEGKAEDSIPYYEEAYSVAKEIANRRSTMEAISNLSRAYVQLHDNRKALRYADEGIEIAIETDDLYMKMDILETKSIALYGLQNYEQAYLTQSEYQEAKDSLINKENLEAIAELQTLYETEQKQKKIVELEKEKALQKLTIQKNRMFQAGLGGTILILIVAGFLWQSKVREKELVYKVKQLEIEKEIQAERERISRDLHDNVGAQLINIISGIDLFERYREDSKDQESKKVLISLREEARSSIGQLRDTIWALNSDENTSESFVEHVNSYLNSVEKMSALVVKAELNQLKEYHLTPSQSLNIFRIIQEATQNTLKHSGANTLNIDGQKSEGRFKITISDNGTFKTPETDGASFGLGNMKKRASDIGAEISIETSGKSMNIILRFPVTKKFKESELN